MQMEMDTLPELPLKQGKLCTRSYRNLGMAVIDFSSTTPGTDSVVDFFYHRKKSEDCFCNATGQEGLYKN